ncbi:hypothetical protein GCM10010265_57550 [Streptomyces griseoincarnatus]|nr:hypothetical protein GCM10010265_57550 [Streptomyces griseoincarnatus]
MTLTDAGIRSGLSSSMNGTKKFGGPMVALSVPEALTVAGLASRVARCARAV